VPGPYAAGVRTVTLVDASRARTLPVEIWYPVDPAAPGGVPNAYFLDLNGRTIAALCSAAFRDGTALEPATPRGLVVFSHGFGGTRFQSFFLAEHLATHGWIVAATDHPGNTFADLDMLSDDAATARSAVDRPLDVAFVLDAMLADGAGTNLAVDPTRVAASGHSFGAWTSIEIARRDDRFAAVVSLAPGFPEPSSPAIAGELDGRPLLLLGGSADGTTPFAEQDAAYAAASAPKLLVRLEGAGHLDFSDLCRVPFLASAFDDGCDPASLDPARARELTAWLTERFLRRYLDGDVSADGDLNVAAVEALGGTTAWRAP
jgi:predicted dienelactone hydrolase